MKRPKEKRAASRIISTNAVAIAYDHAQELVRGISPLQHARDGKPQRAGDFHPKDSQVIAGFFEQGHSKERRRDAETAVIEALYQVR